MEPGTQGNNSANVSRPASSFSNGYPQHHNHSYGGPETSAQMGDDDVRFQFLYHQFKEFLDGGSQFNKKKEPVAAMDLSSRQGFRNNQEHQNIIQPQTNEIYSVSRPSSSL